MLTLEARVALDREHKAAESAIRTHLLARFGFEDAGKLEEWVTTGRELVKAVNVVRKKLGKKSHPQLFWY